MLLPSILLPHLWRDDLLPILPSAGLATAEATAAGARSRKQVGGDSRTGLLDVGEADVVTVDVLHTAAVPETAIEEPYPVFERHFHLVAEQGAVARGAQPQHGQLAVELLER